MFFRDMVPPWIGVARGQSGAATVGSFSPKPPLGGRASAAAKNSPDCTVVYATLPQATESRKVSIASLTVSGDFQRRDVARRFQFPRTGATGIARDKASFPPREQ